MPAAQAAPAGSAAAAVSAPPARRPRGPRWERRKDSRPSELLDAALDLFVERGYAAARLDDVAARAGVSKGTLYLYYANKEELFKAVVRASIVPLLQEFRAEIEHDDRSAEVLLAGYVDAWWTRFGSTRLAGIIKLIIGEAGNFPEVARFFDSEVVSGNHELVTLILRRGVERGEFRDIDVDLVAHSVMAPLVMKSIWANSIEPCCTVARVEPARFVRHHLDLLLRSLRRAP
ncbi:MAG: TetR/AcrR family transcriptional regulator [Lautropia sp.]